MTSITYDPDSGMWVLNCTDCGEIVSSADRDALRTDQTIHDDTHTH